MPNTQTRSEERTRETRREGQMETPEPWVPTPLEGAEMMEREAKPKPRRPARRPTAPRKAKPVRRKAAPTRRGRKAAVKARTGTARKATTRRRGAAPSRTARTGARTKASKYAAEHEEPHRMEAGAGWGKKATRKPRAEAERW